MSSSTGAFTGLRLSSFSSESSSTSSARSGSTSSTPNSASSDAIGYAEDFFSTADRQTQPRQPGPTLDAYASGEDKCHGVKILNAALASAPLNEDDIVTALQAGQGAQGPGARDRHSASRLLPLGSQQDSQTRYLLHGGACEASSSLSEHVKLSHACLEDCAHSSDTMPTPFHTLQLEQAGGRDSMVFCLDNPRSSAPWHFGEHTSNRSQTQLSSAPKSSHSSSSSRPHIQVSSPSPTPSPWQSSFGALTHTTINVPSLRLDTAMPARASSEPLSGASASGVSKTMAFFNFDGASSEAEEGTFAETDRRRSSVPLESPSNLPANASVHETAAAEGEQAPSAGQATLPDQRSGLLTSQPSEMDRDKEASSYRAPYAPTFADLRTATEQRKRKLEDTAIEDFSTNAAMGTEYTPWITAEITSAMTGRYRRIADTGSSEAPKAPASRARGASDPESNWFDARVPGQSDSEAPSHGAEAADLTSSVALAQDDNLRKSLPDRCLDRRSDS
ncbi:hypothetical protein IE81DRAFT_16480 [Ceraceosorus guamensis]|uniref:Uncharacterized protein n=1 Tax=Ceraceosorus guamensis TaxID=1522189 RepID=A0A316VPS1_9BASI|nr:hypothetical protein IE81DRAFT_16480 [Ceraceosorus guamensis]PWN39576.1 hypothetical protein IE81DRAFT_16480 [Ceraceosorus guamensis]